MSCSSRWLTAPGWQLSFSLSRQRHFLFLVLRCWGCLVSYREPGQREHTDWWTTYTVMAQNQTPVLDFGLMAKFNIEVLIEVKPPRFKRFIHFFKKSLLVTEWVYSSEELYVWSIVNNLNSRSKWVLSIQLLETCNYIWSKTCDTSRYKTIQPQLPPEFSEGSPARSMEHTRKSLQLIIS